MRQYSQQQQRHDVWVSFALTAHLFDDGTGSPADRGHRDAAKQVRDQAADEQANDHVWIVETEVGLKHP